MFPNNLQQLKLRQDNNNDISMELRRRGMVVDLSFIFLNDEWDMKGYAKGKVMMMFLWKGKGSWHIMKTRGK